VTSAANRRPFGRVATLWQTNAESAILEAPPRVAPWAVAASAVTPVVLTSAWLVAGALQPAFYSPMRQTVSVLSGHAGTDRWIVTAALYLAGAALLTTAAGIRGMAGPPRVGLVVAGIAAWGVASFPEPVHGTSREHAICTGVGALAIGVWPALVARQESVVATIGPRLSLAASVVSVGLLVWTFAETRNGTLLGLAERVSSGIQITWPCVVAIMLFRAQRDRLRGQAPNGESVAHLVR
jgi:hypothetical protein